MDNNPYNGQQASSETSANTPVGQEGTTVSVPGGNVVADNPVLGDHPSQRILGRQIPSSASRGTQTMTGQTIVNDPSTNRPVITTSAIKQNTVFSDPKTQTPRVIEGLLPDGTYGMWVSKPGVNVTTTTTTGLIFNSNQDVFKIVQSGILTMPNTTANTGSARYISGTVGNLTVAHGLGYAPVVFAYANFGGGYLLLPWVTMGSISATAFTQYTFTAEVDAINIYLVANSFAYGPVNDTYGGFPVKYFLLQESIA